MPDHHFEIVILPREYCQLLLVVLVSLILIYSGSSYYSLEIEEISWLVLQLFHLDEENNIPTWYSSFLLLNCAFVLHVVSKNKLDYRAHWTFLSLGFLILAIDEVAGMHESLNTTIDINWAILGAILVMLVGILFVPFLLSLERRLAILFTISGLLYVSGAIEVELLSEDMDEDSLEYGFSTALEEGLEMLGAWMFLRVNLFAMDKQRVEIEVSLPEKKAN